MTAACPSRETLIRWLDGELAEAEGEGVGLHVAACNRCGAILAQAAEVDVLLAEELGRPPKAALRAWLPLAAAALILVGVGISLFQPAPSLTTEEIVSESRDALPAEARLTALTGGAELHREAAEKSRAAVANELLRVGDRIATGAGQKVKLNLASDADLVLNENSSLRIGSLGEGQVEVSLERGEVLATSGRNLQIRTPGGPVDFESGEMVVRAAADQTTVTLLRGRGRMKGGALEGGEEASFHAKSPLKVKKIERNVDVRWASAVRSIYYEDDFSTAGFSSQWKLSEGASESIGTGRPALSLVAQAAERKGYAYARFGRDLPLDEGLVFEADFRVPRDIRAGRAQVVFPLAGPEGPANLRWSLSHDEELLEAHGDPSGRKRVVLWKGHSSAADGEWHHLRVVVSKSDILLEQDGARLAQLPHGLPAPQKAGLVLGSLAKPKATVPFECRYAGVRLLRQTLE